MPCNPKSSTLVDFLLSEFESRFRREWEDERFSVFPHPSETKHGKLDFDTMFYWKVYAQGYFAMRAGDFFSRLANKMGGGPPMIRHLASLSQDNDRLLATYGRSKVLGYAVTASERLVNLYSQESKSYIAQWFSHCLSDEAWDGRWEGLVESLNSYVKPFLASADPLQRVLQIRDFIVNKFVFSLERHLSGVGPEVLSFFLRDWKDFIGWPYYWKHDSWNDIFWRVVASHPEFGLKVEHKDEVLAFLVRHLRDDDIDNGALATINTTVYRLTKQLREEGVRQEVGRIS